MRRGPLSMPRLRRRAKELRTELYRALPFTACRATTVFYGETTKRVTEASVFTRTTLSRRPDGVESQAMRTGPVLCSRLVDSTLEFDGGASFHDRHPGIARGRARRLRNARLIAGTWEPQLIARASEPEQAAQDR